MSLVDEPRTESPFATVEEAIQAALVANGYSATTMATIAETATGDLYVVGADGSDPVRLNPEGTFVGCCAPATSSRWNRARSERCCSHRARTAHSR